MKLLKIPILLFTLLFAGSAIFAQTPFLRPHLLFRGKEEYNVKVIYQDEKAWMWFGTDRGLFRFDGINYTRFSTSEGLAEDKITAINRSMDGKLWVGHKNGEISLYDGHTFQTFIPEEGLGKVEISSISNDNSGNVWYSTLGEGVYKFDGRYLTNVNVDDGLSDDNVYDIEINPDGVLWFATDYGITRFSDESCEVISMKDGLNDNIVRVLKTSKDGRLWIGTEEQGISIYDPVRKSITAIDGWEYGAITGFTMSLEDEIWVGTEREGIIQLKLNGQEAPAYKKITVNQGLISNRISAIFKDQEENIWIGGRQGVVQALPSVFEFLNKTNGTPFEMVYSLVKDRQKNLWVCSETGLYRGVPNSIGQYEWGNLSEKMNLGKVNFISLYIDIEGQIWAGTYGQGAFRISPLSLRYERLTVKQGLGDNNVISISGNGDIIWLSTLGGGISCYDLAQSSIMNFKDPELKDSYIYAAKTDKSDRTWIAGSLRVPSYIYQDSLYRIGIGGQRPSQLFSIAIDSSDNVWFNTGDNGILRVTGDSILTLGETEGIGFDQIQSIVFDKLNNLLVISNKGILFYNPVNGEILEFGENSGLAYRYPILNSTFTDDEGQVWIGTETGIIKYDPEYLKYINQTPIVFLSVRNLFYSPINPEQKKFRYNQNNFTFGYTGIWFRNPEGLNYRYMLDGFDLKWNYSNRNQNLTYSQLPAGDYTFKVEVSLDEKNWYSSVGSHFTFSVHPPFWQRWWFISVIVLLMISGLYLYINLRLANLEKAKKELEEEVHKRTEEIRNQNEELETQKEEIAAQRDHAEEQRDHIETQNEEIQASIRYAHRIQTAALPPKNQLDLILKDYFVLNKPRDIVSGDFFWVAQNDSHYFFSVGDCTGHGVPGAFMSMLGLSALTDIVKSLQICKASTIMNLLRERIQESLHQVGENEMASNDGMDISLCIYDPQTRKLQFSAAHNPLYIIRNGEVEIIPADKMEIGSYLVEKREFTNHEIQCEPGDLLYLFSDGFPDQFGGPNGKKYKYLQFREFLVSIHNEPMVRQKWLLDEEIESWKGTFPQVDDIMVMGIRIT